MKKILHHIILAAIVVVQSCATITTVPAEVAYKQYPVTGNEGQDSFLLKMLAPYKDSILKTMNRVIGFSLEPVHYRSAASVGNFFTDAMREAASAEFGRVDAAVMNSGGIRSHLSQGDITIGKIFELMPFDNLLVLQHMPGTVLKSLLDRAASAGGWPVSGITMKISNRKADSIMINGQPLDLSGTYAIAISDYLANGGDYCEMLRAIPRESTGYLLRDALIEHVERFTRAGKPLIVSRDKRITHADQP